jgi:hypothetical protein
VKVTSSGLKLKPEHKQLLQREETFLNWFLPGDEDTELGALIRDDVWANPVLLPAPENDSDKEDGEEVDPTAMDEQLALAAAWASDSE